MTIFRTLTIFIVKIITMKKEQPVFYFPSQAKHFGSVTKAAIYNQIVYWAEYNEKRDRNYYDERHWCYMTYDQIGDLVGLTTRQVQNNVKWLEENNYILVGNYNKMWSDRTKWYAPIGNNDLMEGTEMYNGITTSRAQQEIISTSQQEIISTCQQEIISSPIPIKTNKQENQLGVDEGGTPLERVSPTSSSPKKEKKGGWEKFVDMYPSSKQRDIIEASSVWNGLSQRDKQAVFRHSKVYIENTEPQFIKQIGKYLQSDLWRNMKPKMTNTQRYESAGYEVVDCLNENTYSTKKNSILDLMREQGLND